MQRSIINLPTLDRIKAKQQHAAKAANDPLTIENEVVRKELEGHLDKLNELWAVAEAKILGMQPPRHIQHLLKTNEDEHGLPTYSEYLGLQRHGSKWRICYGSRWERGDDAIDWRPITDCSTETRVDCAAEISGLIEEVVRSGKSYIPTVTQAIAALEAAIGS